MKSPCLNCTDRHIGCHAVCERYLAARAEQNAINEWVGAELGIPGLVKAQIEWVKKTIGFDDAIKKAYKSMDNHATGDQGAASATGDQGAASATGIRGVALCSGIDGRVMGALGCAIFGVERGDFDGDTYPIKSIAAAIVDGETIKPGVWYWVRGGRFEEVVEDE